MASNQIIDFDHETPSTGYDFDLPITTAERRQEANSLSAFLLDITSFTGPRGTQRIIETTLASQPNVSFSDIPDVDNFFALSGPVNYRAGTMTNSTAENTLQEGATTTTNPTRGQIYNPHLPYMQPLLPLYDDAALRYRAGDRLLEFPGHPELPTIIYQPFDAAQGRLPAASHDPYSYLGRLLPPPFLAYNPMYSMGSIDLSRYGILFSYRGRYFTIFPDANASGRRTPVAAGIQRGWLFASEAGPYALGEWYGQRRVRVGQYGEGVDSGTRTPSARLAGEMGAALGQPADLPASAMTSRVAEDPSMDALEGANWTHHDSVMGVLRRRVAALARMLEIERAVLEPNEVGYRGMLMSTFNGEVNRYFAELEVEEQRMAEEAQELAREWLA